MTALALSIPKNTTFYNKMIAKELGIYAAILLSRITWSIGKHRDANDTKFLLRDRWWMYSTKYDLMQYSMLSRHKIDTALKKLRNSGIIEVEQFDKSRGDMKNYYTVNYTKLQLLITPNPIIRKPDDGGWGFSIGCLMGFALFLRLFGFTAEFIQ